MASIRADIAPPEVVLMEERETGGDSRGLDNSR